MNMFLDRTALDENTGRMPQPGLVVLLHDIGGIEIGGSCSMRRLGNIFRAKAWPGTRPAAIQLLFIGFR
jgi:hypothetical protein